ncbi:hypothetical protein D3C79_763070 [compost metagenome]
MAIPRVGQELIISYLDGDPDQPIATGRAYRETNLPPYQLPKHKTRMTLKSRSHKGQGFNELRFEDELGQEEVFIHAEKDKNVHIKHNNGVFVGNDRSETVGNDEVITIGHNQSHDIGLNRSLSIGQNHEISIGNDRWERVGNDRFDATSANHRTEVGGHSEHITHGQHHLSAGQGMQRTTTTYQLQASERLVIQGPGGSITIDAQGIHLNGLAITLQGPTTMTAPGSAQAFSLQLSPEAGQACVEKSR